MAAGNSFSRRSFLAALPAAAATGALGQDLSIRMAFNGNYRPLSFRTDGGAFSGILIDILDRIGPETGLHFGYADLPWARAQQMVRAGHYDGLCTVSTAERRDYVEFAPTSLIEEPTVIVYRTGDARAEAAETPDGLGGLHFGEPLGSSWAKEILPHSEIEWVADTDNLLGMIAAARIDASLLGLWTVKAQLAAFGYDNKLSYRVLSVPSDDGAVRFGLRKSFPRCGDIVGKVDSAIRRLKETGVIEGIVQHYIP